MNFNFRKHKREARRQYFEFLKICKLSWIEESNFKVLLIGIVVFITDLYWEYMDGIEILTRNTIKIK